jgi:trimeric autotransporter adhesin
MKKVIGIFILLFVLQIKSFSQNWQQVGGNEVIAFSALYADTVSNTLYAGGVLLTPEGDTVRGVHRWNGTHWEPFAPISDTSLVATIYTITRYKGNIIAGGMFWMFHENLPTNIAKWNGTEWEILGNSNWGFLWGPVFDTYVIQDTLYVAGHLVSIDSIFTIGIAKWDGTAWSDMNTFQELTNSLQRANTIAYYNGELYVGGKIGITFLSPNDSINFDNHWQLIRWNGEHWLPVGEGLGSISIEPVTHLVPYKGKLYISGAFGKSFNGSNKMLKWDGTNYSDVGGIDPCCVKDMVVLNDELYVKGDFPELGGTELAKWDGERWCSLDTDFNGYIYDMEVFNGELYVAGYFFGINGQPMRHVAKWAGGDFTDTCSAVVSANTLPAKQATLTLSPNPAHSTIHITAQLPTASAGIVRLSAYNIPGQPLWQQTLPAAGGELQTSVDVSTWPPGVYFISLEAGGQFPEGARWVEKVVVR